MRIRFDETTRKERKIFNVCDVIKFAEIKRFKIGSGW